MKSHLCLLVFVVSLSSSIFGAQTEPVAPSDTEKTPKPEVSPASPSTSPSDVASVAPANATASAPATATSESNTAAAAEPKTETPTRETKPAPVPTATRAPATSATESSPPVPAESTATVVAREPAPEKPAAAAVAAPAVTAPASPTPPAVAGARPSAPADAVESRAELLAARVSLMEQLLLAQHDREVNLYRDTIRMVTIFGGAFAGLCMIGLLAAAFLNYRALVAVQGMYGRIPSANGVGGAHGLLAAPAAATVPGIERVQASGQRFQSRMTGLEQRLAELEHLAGRDAADTSGVNPLAAGGPSPADASAPAGLEPPPRQEVPRAMILVHKAQTQANMGKLSEALATLDEASTFDNAKTEVHLARGQVLEKLGRLGDALKAYDHAVDADEQNTSALLLKAGVLNRQERFSEALACYERALEVHRAAV